MSLSVPAMAATWAPTGTRAIAASSLIGATDLGALPGSYPEGGYNDIIVGSNGLYPATPGYDLNTGLGTFIVNQFTQDLAP
jgi:hypothetical protein